MYLTCYVNINITILLIFMIATSNHYEKKGCFATSLATQFLSCSGHLQLIVFICCECHQTNYNCCKSCNSSYIQCNSFSTTMQPPNDYNHNVMLTSFLSIHENLTCDTMRIFHDFFEILISIIHYDYSFQMVLGYDAWHNQKLPCDILRILETNIYMYLGRSIHNDRQVS